VPITEEDEPTYALLLTGVGKYKIQVIKEVRSASGLPLKEAKGLTDQVQGGWRKTVVIGPMQVVQRVASNIETAGGSVEVHLASEIAIQERYVLDSDRLRAHIKAAAELAGKLGRDSVKASLLDALDSTDFDDEEETDATR
jgi:Ribosomal protein L7/L12 C-terminal domain